MKVFGALALALCLTSAASTRAGSSVKCDYMTDLGQNCGPVNGSGGFDPDPGQIGAGLNVWAWPSCANPLLTLQCGGNSQGWWEAAAPGGNLMILDESCCASSRQRWHYVILDEDGNPSETGDYDCFDPAECTSSL